MCLDETARETERNGGRNGAQSGWTSEFAHTTGHGPQKPQLTFLRMESFDVIFDI